jgi:CheY-like chemotaxis protein
MNILVLEDSLERIEWFKERLPKTATVYYTDKIEEAITLLGKIDFESIFLDHDLKLLHYDALYFDDEKYLKYCETVIDKETGMAVAKYLNETPEMCQKAQIIIHTMNTIGQRRMQALLQGRNPQVIPFNALQRRLRIGR